MKTKCEWIWNHNFVVFDVIKIVPLCLETIPLPKPGEMSLAWYNENILSELEVLFGL